MRTSGTVIIWPSSTGSCTSPWESTSASAWRTASPTRSCRCDGSAEFADLGACRILIRTWRIAGHFLRLGLFGVFFCNFATAARAADFDLPSLLIDLPLQFVPLGGQHIFPRLQLTNRMNQTKYLFNRLSEAADHGNDVGFS